MMLHATMQVAGSIARRVGTGVLSITLDKLPAARARGSARYVVTMAADAVGGGESVRFVDARGYVRGLTLQDVGSWLAKYLRARPSRFSCAYPMHHRCRRNGRLRAWLPWMRG